MLSSRNRPPIIIVIVSIRQLQYQTFIPPPPPPPPPPPRRRPGTDFGHYRRRDCIITLPHNHSKPRIVHSCPRSLASYLGSSPTGSAHLLPIAVYLSSLGCAASLLTPPIPFRHTLPSPRRTLSRHSRNNSVRPTLFLDVGQVPSPPTDNHSQDTKPFSLSSLRLPSFAPAPMRATHAAEQIPRSSGSRSSEYNNYSNVIVGSSTRRR